MKRVILKNCNIIDGINDNVLEHSYVVIENDVISEVGRGAPNILSDDNIIDCDGKYLTPGLIDCHVHLVWDGSEDPQSKIGGKDDETVALMAYKHALETLSHGVTTVRDVASPGKSVISTRNAINEGYLIGPTIIASGPAICMTGGHVHYIGLEADGADEVRKTARRIMKDGADLIKVMATGGIYTFGEEPGSPQLTMSELQAAVEEAHNKNKMIAAHAEGLEGIRTCIEAGIDTIEHGIYADEETLIKMRENGTILVPTMVVFKRLANSDSIPSWALEKAKKVVEVHQEMLENAIKIGVEIATGTDCGSPVTPPKYYFDELIIMEEAGMSAMDVIKSSTKKAADSIGLTDRGWIEKGNKADLLLLTENPLHNLRVFSGEKRVMKDGKFLDELEVYPKSQGLLHV